MCLHHFKGNVHLLADAPGDDAHVAYACLAEFVKEVGRKIHFLVVDETGEIGQIARCIAKALLDFFSAPIEFVVDVANHAIFKLRAGGHYRSEEHTSELQSHLNLVCRLLLEKK